MAVPSPLTLNPLASSSPAIDGAGVAYAAVEDNEIFGVAANSLDSVTWFAEESLSRLFGRGITGLGLNFIFTPTNGPPIPPFPGFWGRESLAELLYQICNVQVLIGSTVKMQVQANAFLDTQKIQRQLEVFIRPPMPSNNDALKFRVFSGCPLPNDSGGSSGYRVTSIFRGYFPPNGSEPGTLPPPQGIGPIRF